VKYLRDLTGRDYRGNGQGSQGGSIVDGSPAGSTMRTHHSLAMDPMESEHGRPGKCSLLRAPHV